jgi:hypothetical protein
MISRDEALALVFGGEVFRGTRLGFPSKINEILGASASSVFIQAQPGL